MRLPIWLAMTMLLSLFVAVSADPPPPKAAPAAPLVPAAKTEAVPATAKTAPAVAVPKAVPPPPIEPWIDQLASRDFRLREAAVKEIMKAGVPALPALRKVRDHRDAEVRRRVEELIATLDRAAALAPKLITLKMDKKPVREVLNEMAKQTGFKIPTTDAAFNGPQGKKPYSFQFDRTPFWNALDNVCEKCGLIVSASGNDNTLQVNFQDVYEPFKCYDGSFKVQASGFNYTRNNNFGELPKTPYQPGDQTYESLQLLLQVCVEPRVPILKVGQVRVTVAEDDTGTSMAANGNNYYDPWGMRYYSGGNNRSFVQATSLNLAWPSKNSRTVKTIKGFIPVTLLAEQKPAVVTESLLSSKGKKIKIENVTFVIDDVSSTKTKQHEIKLTVNEESGDNPYDYGRFQSMQQRFELQDAKGNKVPHYIRSSGWNGTASMNFTLMTQNPNNSKVGPPVKLIYQLWVQMEHEVAFEFKNLPLP
jgi:hypothetical protein